MRSNRCEECGVTLTTEDAYCDGIVCSNGHQVLESKCDGICRTCTQQGRHLADNRKCLLELAKDVPVSWIDAPAPLVALAHDLVGVPRPELRAHCATVGEIAEHCGGALR